MPWNRAMDKVRVERLIQKYKDNGELVSEDPALVMLKKWPASKQYQDNLDRLPGLERLVCIMYKITSLFILLNIKTETTAGRNLNICWIYQFSTVLLKALLVHVVVCSVTKIISYDNSYD